MKQTRSVPYKLGVTRRRPPRILLYSHDSHGLGHLRRTVTIAEALHAALPGAAIMITTGSACATLFRCPENVQMVKLPGIAKGLDGEYASPSAGMPLEQVRELRVALLGEIYRGFRPDLVIVDHKVLGLLGELSEVLDLTKDDGAQLLLSLRDIIDEPSLVEQEWSSEPMQYALRSLYDRVAVHGDPAVFDARTEYKSLSQLGDKVEYMGYLARSGGGRSQRTVPSLRPSVLVTPGGGQDGLEFIDTYLEALESRAVSWESNIVLGPLFPADLVRKYKQRARSISRVSVRLAYDDMLHIMRGASTVVSRAGYNSVAEVLTTGTPAILMPSTQFRQEQVIRARRMHEQGLVKCQEGLDSESLLAAIEGSLTDEKARGELPRLDGVQRMAESIMTMFRGRFAVPARLDALQIVQ